MTWMQDYIHWLMKDKETLHKVGIYLHFVIFLHFCFISSAIKLISKNK